MTLRSFINKYNKSLMFWGALVAVIAGLLNILNYLPGWVAFMIFTLAIILCFPFIWKFKKPAMLKRVACWTIFSLFYTGMSYYLLFGTRSSSTSTGNKVTVNVDDHSKNSQIETTTVSNTSTKTEIREAGIVINGGISTHDNSKVTIAEKINNYNYSKPPQRRLNAADIKKLAGIPPGAGKIKILYPPNDNEATIFANEIFDKAYELGFKNVSKGTVESSKKSTGDRFTIQPTRESQNQINIFINPQ